MKTIRLAVIFLFLLQSLTAQNVKEKIAAAVQQLQADGQNAHATIALYVINSSTGETVYGLNEQTGLAPASCQKIFTSICAMDLLGPQYRFKTDIGYDGVLDNGTLQGNIHITGYGDPTLGSWRYAATKDTPLLGAWMDAIAARGIRKITGSVLLDYTKFSFQPVPDGWTWSDLGNYYGAGHWALNWHENQFDLFMQPGEKEGDSVQILRSDPVLPVQSLVNLLRTGKKGSGDQASVFLAPYSTVAFAEGTVPAGEKEFHISGALPQPSPVLESLLEKQFRERNISVGGGFGTRETPGAYLPETHVFFTWLSPALDSINYYFLKRSVNLYGETLLRTIAFEKNGFGRTDSGIAILKRFWIDKGIDKQALNVMDGSGLSPQNRVTAFALVSALQYARSRPWFSTFYFDLPEYNGMKLKSGTISGVKCFAGYHTAKDGTGYTVAILVNNFNGSPAEVVKKMFLVLDELK